MSFGENLRSLIEERDMTQKELAIQLNIAPSTMGSYVQNTREPDFATLNYWLIILMFPLIICWIITLNKSQVIRKTNCCVFFVPYLLNKRQYALNNVKFLPESIIKKRKKGKNHRDKSSPL